MCVVWCAHVNVYVCMCVGVSEYVLCGRMTRIHEVADDRHAQRDAHSAVRLHRDRAGCSVKLQDSRNLVATHSMRSIYRIGL